MEGFLFRRGFVFESDERNDRLLAIKSLCRLCHYRSLLLRLLSENH
ncbi:hypothetical protein SLEP1_g38127 [Rubroshorea leprosula]|uniref:Maturase K n=1 Tax=Rubroshorea leprosula TaxID=152421 RepID=A0AAV5KWY0_9ROSI|nr:hypothetical protein SLEP1_g38127 [Rubroshorea leprosula]